jgi:hypothetical protein
MQKNKGTVIDASARGVKKSVENKKHLGKKLLFFKENEFL